MVSNKWNQLEFHSIWGETGRGEGGEIRSHLVSNLRIATRLCNFHQFKLA